MRAVARHSLSYLEPEALLDLHDRVAELERVGRPGVLIEAGSARGGSALVIAASKDAARTLRLYDTFTMIPPPSERDGPDGQARYETIASGRATGIAGGRYYGYVSGLADQVRDAFLQAGIEPRTHRVELVEGLFDATLQVNEPVALAHIDADWYESVLTCLERIEPWLVEGGVIVLDDYAHWSGCRAAVDEYFAGRRSQYRFERRSRLHVVRVRARTPDGA